MQSADTLQPATYRRVFKAGTCDDRGHVLGGTEVLHLVAHRGRLFSSLSYTWNDYGPEDPATGAQIAVLDGPDDDWQLDVAYARAHWRATLASVTLMEDSHGRRTQYPAPLLLAGPSDSQGFVYVDCRNDETGSWTRSCLGRGDGAASVRSFFVYRDKVTGRERVFAGASPLGIFSGVLDSETTQNIRWDIAPEMEGRPHARPMGFAECEGRLYVSIKQDIYRRIDGETAAWERVYTLRVPLVAISSGLRGLTVVPRGTGVGQVLLAALEGDFCRVLRIDPQDNFRETIELDVLDFLRVCWGSRPAYGIVAYDDFTSVVDPSTGEGLLIAGVGATYSEQFGTHPTDDWVQDAWYLIRHPGGSRYELGRIESRSLDPMPRLFAARSIVLSPFQPGMLYVGGYDPNAKRCRHTAWVFSASVEAALAACSVDAAPARTFD